MVLLHIHMEQANTSKRKKNKAWGVVSAIFMTLLFCFSIFMLAYRLSGNAIYFGNVRYDWVKSDSMSQKHPAHIDFLKDYDNQLQKYDLTVSERITEETELKVGDIVMYKTNNRNYITHRIYDIKRNTVDTYYGIRGDANLDSDGWFLKSSLEARVIKIVPKGGYVFGYVTGFWGISMMIGIVMVYLIYEIVIEINNKKKEKLQIVENNNQTLPTNNENIVEEEEIKSKVISQNVAIDSPDIVINVDLYKKGLKIVVLPNTNKDKQENAKEEKKN